jgi:hypothetical protein
MKPNKSKQKLTLSKQSISLLTPVNAQKINGGNVQKPPVGFTSVLGCETQYFCCPTLTGQDPL